MAPDAALYAQEAQGVGLIVCLTRYPAKGKAGEALQEMALREGAGIVGDAHQGGARQISLLAADVRRWIDAQIEGGLCFHRFRENVLIEGLPMDMLESDSLLSAGTAHMRINKIQKACFDDCSRFTQGLPCRLAGSVAYATVEQGGMIRVGDSVELRTHHG